MPEQLSKDVANDYDHRITVKEKGGYLHVCNDSKYMGNSIIYRLNEEFEFTLPGMDEPIKAIETACGDTYTMVQKCSKFVVKSCAKITTNYMVIDSWLCGKGLRSKAIYMRCCGDKKP